jgi:hypothetical protein
MTTGLLAAVVGCRGEKPGAAAFGAPGTETSAALADKGAAAIATVCTRQSYATAKLGLIAGETGLREDVFEMRDPVSYRIVPYELAATVRMEALLRQGAEAAGRPTEQAACMRDFADHLKTLSDPLVENAENQKKVDALAFRDAEKEATQEVQTDEQMQKNPR